MFLTPREIDKLNIFTAAELARKRKRDGKSVSDLMSSGKNVLKKDEVLPGVSEIIHTIQVEATFEDGTKLVTIHDPIV